MESAALSRKNLGGKKVGTTRRSWTVFEEVTLVSSLKELVARGYKCDNGFKAGYLGILEKSMHQAFPGSGLKAEPHIHSKIHVWKKNYATLKTMMSRSGFGWNDSNNTIDVASDDVWDNFVKSDSSSRTMRYKPWPYYKDWAIIFGKDRATGENALDLEDVQSVLHGQVKFAGTPYDQEPLLDDDLPTEADLDSGAKGPDSSGGSSSKDSRKRKAADGDDRFFDLMNSWCEKTEACMRDIAKKLGVEYDVSAARKSVFEFLMSMPFLDLEDQISIAHKICHDDKDLDLFVSLPDDRKQVMATMYKNGTL